MDGKKNSFLILDNVQCRKMAKRPGFLRALWGHMQFCRNLTYFHEMSIEKGSTKLTKKISMKEVLDGYFNKYIFFSNSA